MSVASFADPLTERLAAFVRGDGIEVRDAALPALIENFTAGRYFGMPLLQFYGMAVEPRRAAETAAEPYPHMRRWLR